ncbi:MAG TPA: hypothetical protein VFL95_11075 [Gemmatimonadales bacterium]|nr:hypothetical protein [Gemmatimonadales bacterium]
MKPGVCLYGLASIAAGAVNLIWGDFETAHQPIQAFGDQIPARAILAWVAAVWLIAGGAAILWRRTAKWGGAALTLIYGIFAIFWLPRFYTVIPVLGFRADVYIGLLAGVGQQLILAAAALIVYATATATGESRSSVRALGIARWIFGLSSIVFGLAHLADIKDVGPMVPAWMPLGGKFWAIVTGAAFVLAGVAIVARTVDVLASRLLALMLLVFSALALLPPLFTAPAGQIAWGSNAYNLAAVGAAWILASSLASLRQTSNAPVRRR